MKAARWLLLAILFLSLSVWLAEQTTTVWKEYGGTFGFGSRDVVTYYGEDGERYETELNGDVIVIDAGHGGADPGKVGTLGTKEKEVNLAISYKLCEVLSRNGYVVVMTRSDDNGLYADETSGKKLADMKARVAIMNEAGATCVISIHQNSYPSEEVRGAQSFYYSSSAEGKRLAESIQTELLCMDPANHRKAKANDDYYILRNTTPPVVLVECGFLSSTSEEQLLLQEDYQWKVAEAIAAGVEAYRQH